MAMIENDWEAIEKMIAQMSASEKQRLLTTVARTLATTPTVAVLADQKRTLHSLLVEMEQLPAGSSDDGFSNRDDERQLDGHRR